MRHDHPIAHAGEVHSNRLRMGIAADEPRSLRTFTPTQAVLASSAGSLHWTPEGRRLYDFTSGVLVANLGHNPVSWMRNFSARMGWPGDALLDDDAPAGYFRGTTMTAYNAITPVEVEANRRLLECVRGCPGGDRLEVVMWAASGSEAVQKALWASTARDRTRPIILATRNGFHGKKGLAGAVSGSEHDADRDPRVEFISFPRRECADLDLRDEPFDATPYEAEWDALLRKHGRDIGTLITEPYLGGGGSYHPPKAYLQRLEAYCRRNDIVFILDEVQANFGRTGSLFAYETYGLTPDIVVLGKGLGNGVPVAAAVGRRDLFDAMGYGEGSDTWSANPLNCAAVLATLDEFAARDVLGAARASSAVLEAGLVELKALPYVGHVRGEKGGMVWGVEMRDSDGVPASEWANRFVHAAYLGDGSTGGDGVHLLGPLAKTVVRVSPPLVITQAECRDALALLHAAAERIAESVGSARAV